MKFRDYFSLRQIIFSAFIIVLVLVFAFLNTGTVVEAEFGEDKLVITSSRYNLSIRYNEIASAELAELPEEPGEEVKDTYDDDILLVGVWNNDIWGEYTVCAYSGTSNCVVVHLNDGRIFVFSRKDDGATRELYEQLLTYIPAQ